MRYTIAIPTHNNFDIIEACVQHALKVEHNDFEVEIIISDTSDDERAMEIIRPYQSENVKIYHNDSSWSMWQNHNFLLSEAHGDYIFFIHSDDEILPDALKIIDKYLKKFDFPKRILISGTSIYKNFQNELKHIGLMTEKLITGSDALSIFSNSGISPSGMLFSKDLHDMGGFIGDSMILPYSDCWTEINCALNGFKILFIDNILFLRSTNGTTLKRGDKKELLEAYNRMKIHFNEAQIKLIIESAVRQRGIVILEHFYINETYKKYIRKYTLKYLILHPIKYRKFIKFYL